MKRRNLVAVALLSFFTFGIYGIYWFYKTRLEMMSRGAKNIPPVIVLFLPALLLIAGFILFAVLNIATGPAQVSADGTVVHSSAMPVAVMVVFAIVVIALVVATPIVVLYWLYRYAVGVEVVTAGKMSSGFVFTIYIICAIFVAPFIWQVVIQNEFNRIADTPPSKVPAET